MTKLVLSLSVVLTTATLVFAHGGGVDSNGGHNDRKNGRYHFHRGPLAGKSYPTKSAALRALADARKPRPATPKPSALAPVAPAARLRAATSAQKLDALIAALVKKGLVTEAELAAQLTKGRR